MNLDSVRELKQTLSKSVLSHVAESMRTRSGFGVASQALSAVSATPRSLALGIAPQGGFKKCN